MAAHSRTQTKTNRSAEPNKQPMLQMALFSFVAASVGTVVGFIAAMAVALPIIHQEVAAQTHQLGAKLASSVTSAAPASSCAQPTSSGVVLGAAVFDGVGTPVHHPIGGAGGGTPFVQKLVGGLIATTSGSISNTGPNSDNKIITNNTSITHIENNNDIAISNSTDQNASSGDAKVVGNTTGGDAVSGEAANSNETSLAITVSN